MHVAADAFESFLFQCIVFVSSKKGKWGRDIAQRQTWNQRNKWHVRVLCGNRRQQNRSSRCFVPFLQRSLEHFQRSYMAPSDMSMVSCAPVFSHGRSLTTEFEAFSDAMFCDFAVVHGAVLLCLLISTCDWDTGRVLWPKTGGWWPKGWDKGRGAPLSEVLDRLPIDGGQQRRLASKRRQQTGGCRWLLVNQRLNHLTATFCSSCILLPHAMSILSQIREAYGPQRLEMYLVVSRGQGRGYMVAESLI